MKKQILTIACFLFFITVYAQVEPKKDVQKQKTNEELAQYYRQKSKKQKKTGWTLLGSGVVLYGVTALAATRDLDNVDGEVQMAAAMILFSIGTASSALSIPFFIAGSKSKRNALLLLQQNDIRIGPENRSNTTIRSVGIGIPLGR